MKQLERLLFLQGQRCFFCQQTIPNGESSIEHIIASSNGGGNEDENCVACCKTLNAALGNLSIKEKLQVILNQRGQMICPAKPASEVKAANPPPPQAVDQVGFDALVANLKGRGTSQPRSRAALLSTISAFFQKKITDAQAAGVLAALVKRGYVALNGEKVSYAFAQGQAKASLKAPAVG